MIQLTPVDNIYMQISTDLETLQGLYEYFSFRPVGYEHMPKYVNEEWDGVVRLVKYDGRIYRGLLQAMKKYAADNKKQIDYQQIEESEPSISEEQAKEFFSKVADPKKFSPRDHQLSSFINCVNSERKVIESATGSGKSLTIHALAQYYKERGKKIIIIVPRVSLVKQIFKDFKDYAGKEIPCNLIYSGQEKETCPEAITITTWQSIIGFVKTSKTWFAQFDCVICDEVHKAKGRSLSTILEKLVNCDVRLGFTGSLTDEKVHNLVVQGLLGDSTVASKAHELIDKGELSTIKINVIVLHYTKMEKLIAGKLSYQEQIDFINSHERRWALLKKIALSKTRNALILFSRRDKFGVPLYKELKVDAPNRPIYLITSETKINERERIREQVEKDENAIILATYSIFSEGINIKNLYHLIGASATASEQRIIQSIGRILRIGKDTSEVQFDDIVDDLSKDENRNYLMQHAIARMNVYDKHRYPYRILDYNL